MQQIADSVGSHHEIICEIGAGNGALTEYLATRCKELVCIEVHRKFSEVLTRKFIDSKRVTIINADILKFDLATLGNDLVLVGNLPYHISKSLVLYFIKNRALIKRGFFMFQTEFVDKLIAQVGDDGYGGLSCYMRYYSNMKKVINVPKEAFDPVPKVNSSVLEMDFDVAAKDRAKDENKLFNIINFAFSQRRKKIINVLKQRNISKQSCLDVGITTDDRAENVSLEQYIELVNKVQG